MISLSFWCFELSQSLQSELLFFQGSVLAREKVSKLGRLRDWGRS